MSVINDLDSAGSGWLDVLADKNVDWVRSEIKGIGRWSYTLRRVFSVDGRFYAVETEEPNTEYQDVDDEPVFYEVEPYEKTCIDYRPVAAKARGYV